MSKYDGGPAFPHPNGQIEKGASWMRIPFAHGLSLRDAFFIAALPACINKAMDVAALRAIEKDTLESIGTTMERAVYWAWKAADEGLAARSNDK